VTSDDEPWDEFPDEGTAAIATPSRPALTPETAAEMLFDSPFTEPGWEPDDEKQARSAVEHFGRLFERVPGVLKAALDGARGGAETLSGDRFQGLAEIIQNADDTGARWVQFQVVGDRLVATHDGRPVRLPDVLALTTPWVSNKVDDANAVGRFGIGLMTLRALSDVLEVHSGPYHLRLGDPAVSATDPVAFPASVAEGATTVFSVGLPPDVDTTSVERWLDRWDDTALLFCRTVERVTLVHPDGTPTLTLALDWTEDERARCQVGEDEVPVLRRRAQMSDGRSWVVHSTNAPTPAGVTRARKASAETVPLALALPLQAEPYGFVYAGLPVVETRVPVRVNAPFDPTTSRKALADTAWNRALLPLLADLWVEAVDDLFAQQPSIAWDVVPLTTGAFGDGEVLGVTDRFEQLLVVRARSQVAARLRIAVGESTYQLSGLATEDAHLEGLVSPEEIAYLAGLPAALPTTARDAAGRWRLVLDDWRDAGAPVPMPVTVERALDLLQDTTPSPSATVALAAAGIDAGLDHRLAALPWVVTASGERITPPTGVSLDGLVLTASALAERLGVGVRLHDAHRSDSDAATRVLTWLRQQGAVIDDADAEGVVRRLAAAGRAGQRLTEPFTDEQARALRDAFEVIPADDRATLGRDVGAAIMLAAFSFDAKGRRVPTSARPIDAYLPRAIDREPDSFALAADHAPGILWLHSRFAETLRSPLGRGAGLGPQRFLRLLGAEIAPRLATHPQAVQRFSSDPRRGLSSGTKGGPPQRAQAMRALGATYTVDDRDSPDLRTVVDDIAREKKAMRRRERAAALLGTLGRAWDRLADSAEVTAATDHYAWNRQGDVRAFWLWSAGSVAWLDDAEGTPRAPLNLRLRTPATVAIHGSDATGYLRPELDVLNRREVLAALGVTGEPSTGHLVERLRELRTDNDPSAAADAAVVYEALADRMGSHTAVPGDLSQRDLRAAFAEGAGLVRTQLGWRRPSSVLAGPPVFDRRRAFVPAVRNTDRLWDALQIRRPSFDDCLAVIAECARSRRAPSTADQTVLLETLRLLGEKIATATMTPPLRRRLGKLALWTTQGWQTRRPVYAVDDPTLVEGLGTHVPVWLPGGELPQFEELLEPLRVHRLSADDTTVVEPGMASIDEEATSVLRAAIPLLHEDLARNEPAAVGVLRVSWPHLQEFLVRIDSDLHLRVDGLVSHPSIEIPVVAKADVEANALYLSDHRVLRQVDGGGRAIAALFTADQRRIAQAWLAACVAAEEGRAALELALAEQRQAEERDHTDAKMAERLAAFRQEAAAGHTGSERRRPSSARSEPVTAPNTSATPPPPLPRVLVDPAALTVADPQGRLEEAAGDGRTAASSRRDGPGTGTLPAPSRNGATPRSWAPAAGFTQQDAESVGLELVRKVLAGDQQELVDLRAQHSVGADAIDTLDRFYELKVYRHEEPDTIRFEESQIRRAMSTPDFFLVVVSGIEGADARPKVRVIIDPLHQLQMTETSSVNFTGIRSAEHSLVYDLVPVPGGDA
jgi:hypothetical protein